MEASLINSHRSVFRLPEASRFAEGELRVVGGRCATGRHELISNAGFTWERFAVKSLEEMAFAFGFREVRW